MPLHARPVPVAPSVRARKRDAVARLNWVTSEMPIVGSSVCNQSAHRFIGGAGLRRRQRGHGVDDGGDITGRVCCSGLIEGIRNLTLIRRRRDCGEIAVVAGERQERR